jgi:hypothetical protein
VTSHRGSDPEAVLRWNEIAARTDLTSQEAMQEGVLHLAYVQAAVFDAVDAIDGGYRPYVGHLHAEGATTIRASRGDRLDRERVWLVPSSSTSSRHSAKTQLLSSMSPEIAQ